MKYVVPASTLKVLEEENFEILYSVDIRYNSMSRRPGAAFNGWIIEAEESFDLYCAIKYGRQNIISIYENEIYHLNLDNAVFFDKERGRLICERFYRKYDK